MSAGFLPTSISLVTCWLYMVLTSLLLVEMNLWWGPGANLVTMVQKTLGKTVRARYLHVVFNDSASQILFLHDFFVISS